MEESLLEAEEVDEVKIKKPEFESPVHEEQAKVEQTSPIQNFDLEISEKKRETPPKME